MKIAVFPGSFDPITNAHVDIVERALSLFDKVYVAIGVNHAKTGLLSHDERLAVVKSTFADMPQVEAVHFKGLTVDFCREVGAAYILRGIRNTNDFEFEKAIAHNNETLAKDVETVFLISRIGFSHVSSTIIREIFANQGDISSLAPEKVVEFLKSKVTN